MNIQKLKQAAYEIRNDVLAMGRSTGNIGAHMGGGLSMVEIMAALYAGVMTIDSKNPTAENRDRFILSKGHGAITLYAALCHAGFISHELLETFKSNETFLYGHPSMNPEIGIEFSSGSLGQGLSLGVGVCLGLKRKNNSDSRAFVLMGDGECDEGSVWESAASASHYKLNNLVAVIDCNGIQYDGATEEVLSMNSMAQKWKSFGFEVYEVDGHDVEKLAEALDKRTDKPRAVIAHTVKGKGVSFMENDPKWHNNRLTAQLYEQALSEQEAVK